MRIAYADPPYPGCAHLYRDQESFGGEVDHADLIARLERDFDGWVLHTASTTLHEVLRAADEAGVSGFRIAAWVKPFAAFKRNVSVAYAWEPVLVKPVRKPVVSGRVVMRDWFSQSITLRKGLTGAKPHAVCRWLFEVAGLQPDDELVDLFPGTGAVTEAWESWRQEVLAARASDGGR